MTCDKDVLRVFLKECIAGTQGLKTTSSLVVMNNDRSCSVIEAGLSRLEEVTNMITGTRGALGWKLFDDHASADRFVNNTTHTRAAIHLQSRYVSFRNFVSILFRLLALTLITCVYQYRVDVETEMPSCVSMVRDFIHRAVDFSTKRNGEQTVGDELKELYLVTLKYDGRAALFTSSAELVLNQVVDVKPNSDLYYRWKLFDDMKEAELLVERLKSIDKTIHIPESPAVKRTER